MPEIHPYWLVVPPTPEEYAELEMIVMGTEHGRPHPQPSWSIVDMPLWKKHPTASNFSVQSRTVPYEPFFAMAIRTYQEAQAFKSVERIQNYLAKFVP